MDKYCRFCGEQKDNLYNTDNLNMCIKNWLQKIVNLEDDNLPNKLCYSCFCTIEDINFFLEKCIKTYKIFKSNLTAQSEVQLKLEVEIKEEEVKQTEIDTKKKEYQMKLEFEENEEMQEEYLIDNDYSIDNVDWLETEESLESVKQIKTDNMDLFEKTSKSFKCSLCSEEYSTDNEESHYSTHLITHLNDCKSYNYKCRFCEFQCNDKEKIAYHMKRDHLNNNKNALFKDLLAIVIDQRSLIKNEDKISKSITINPSQELNEIEDIIIDESSTKENGENKIDKDIDYIKLLNLADVYECKICNINFPKKTSFNKHWDALHLSREEKELKRQKNKNRNQFLCTECGKSLPSAFKLEYHIRMHQNDRQYKCNLCPKTYVSKSHLETHMYRHTGIDALKIYACEICRKKFRTPSELKIHQRFHRNERPFKCEYCQKSFYLKSHLQSHVKGHLNERTYVCEEPGCTQSYRDKNAFRRHKDSHLPDYEKSYECDICNNKFSTFGIMKDHRRKSHSKKHKQNPINEDNFINNIIYINGIN